MQKGILTLADIDAYIAEHVSDAKKVHYNDRGFLDRTKSLAAALGDPQEKCNVVHIAGTSGKGSTAFMIASLLVGSGHKTGLFTSPHLTDVRERFVIDQEMISEEKFCAYFRDIIEAVESLEGGECGIPTYFEILTVLAYHIFVQERCAYAVMETGLGGRCDATNIVQRSDKIAVITPIGFDHTKIIGSTLDKIATEKAAIIHEQNMVFVAPQNAIARDVIIEKGEACNSQLFFLRKNDVDKITLSEEGTHFILKDDVGTQTYKIGLVGIHQAYNAALAIEVARGLSQRDSFSLGSINETLSKKVFPGRFELKKSEDKTLILDGAHNPQKMAALVGSFMRFAPHEKCTVIFAVKEQKDHKAMLELLVPITGQLIITQFGEVGQDYYTSSMSAESVTQEAKKVGYVNVITEPDLMLAQEEAQKQDNKKILVTGSLYLVGKMIME